MLQGEITPQPGSPEIREQLERIVGSSLFRSSRRYSPLLRYIVEETLSGRGDVLKERTIGICVFGRQPDYDNSADPVVRISAGEVRKRIAQYYQMSGHERELRIEVPLGAYQPRFYQASPQTWSTQPLEVPWSETQCSVEVAASTERSFSTTPTIQGPEPKSERLAILISDEPLERAKSRPLWVRVHLTLIYVLLVGVLSALGSLLWRTQRPPQLPPAAALFWGPFLHSPEPTLIVLGIHSFDAAGNDISYRSHAALPQTQQTLLSAMTRSDMVHLSDLTSYAALTTLLTHHNHAFRTQGAADVTLEQLRQGPFLLVGGFNNLWTTKLTQKLRFRFVTLTGARNVIQDSLHPERIWTVDTSQRALSNIRDYGMVSCFFDPQTSQYILIAGGIGKSGTEAATDFLTQEHGLESWLQSTTPSQGRNVQVILATDVIEGKAGSPQVIDFVRW